ADEGWKPIRSLSGECAAQAGIALRVVAVDGDLPGAVAAIVEHRAGARRPAGARNQVDHPTDGVGAVDGGTRTLDDLDPLEELRSKVGERCKPDGARVDADPVDHHDGLIAVGPANEQRQRLARTAGAPDIEAGVKA